MILISRSFCTYMHCKEIPYALELLDCINDPCRSKNVELVTLFLLYLHVFLVKFCLFVSLLFNVSLEKICLYADIEWYKQAFTCFMFYSLRKIRESSLEIMCGTPSEYYSVLILVRHLEYPFRKIIHLEKVLVPNWNF